MQFAFYDAIYGAQAFNDTSAVLDVGCGKGEWLAWLHQRGLRQLHGVDASPSDIEQARQTAPGSQLSLGDGTQHLLANPETFDLIHAKDVIEHMTKDEFITFLQAALRALKPGGQLWLLSFNAQAPLSGAIRYGDFTHESGHTPASLAQCLRACGFGAVAVRGLHYCSKSLSGRVRALLAWPVLKVSRLMLRLRHGGADAQGDIDLFASQPDLFARARKL